MPESLFKLEGFDFCVLLSSIMYVPILHIIFDLKNFSLRSFTLRSMTLDPSYKQHPYLNLDDIE